MVAHKCKGCQISKIGMNFLNTSFPKLVSYGSFLAKLTEITVCTKGPQLILKNGTFSHNLASLWRGEDLRMGLTAD